MVSTRRRLYTDVLIGGAVAGGIVLFASTVQQYRRAPLVPIGMKMSDEPRFAATWERISNASEWHERLLEVHHPNGCLNSGLPRLFWCARVVLELLECAVAGHGGNMLDRTSECGASIRAAVERRAASIATVHLQQYINDKGGARAPDVRVVSHAVHEACALGREQLLTLPAATGSAEQRETILSYAHELRAHNIRAREALMNEWFEAFSSHIVRHEAWPETAALSEYTIGSLSVTGMPQLGEAALVCLLEDCLAQPWHGRNGASWFG